MSAVSSQVPSATALAPMVVIVKGKVLRVRRHEQTFFTTVVTPAQDEYSRPQFVEIRSRERIGDAEQVITQRCRLGGYEGRSYRVTDKHTGEPRTAVPVNHTLDAL